VELQNYSNRTQPLSLLLKQNQHVTELALYDVVNSPGVATDLSHISSPAVRANPHTSPIHE
jgi:malate/lactate dehydrogenase